MPDTIASMFSTMDTARSASLERKRECASLTIPGLLPERGFNETQELDIPYSSVPARLVDSLAAKLTGTSIPLNNLRYFETALSPAVVQDQDPTEITKASARAEAAIVDSLGATNLRQMFFLCMQQIIVAGDCLLCMYDNGTFQVHRIDNYVVERYGDGSLYRIIIREWFNKNALPSELSRIKDIGGETDQNSTYEAGYLEIVHDLESDSYKFRREFRNRIYDTGSWKILPYWAMRYEAIANESYGRSLCEKHLGDLRKLNGISKAIIDGIAINAEFRWGVDPSGITEPGDFVDTDNCSFVPARQADLFPIQAGTMVNVTEMFAVAQELEKSLSMAFLVETSAQPHQERVTATQIRSIGSEFSSTLTGVLSLINTELKGIIRRKMYLEKDKIPEIGAFLELIKEDLMTIKIRTGLEALGREMENTQIGGIVEQVLRMPPQAQEIINWSNLVERYFASTGINTNGLVLSAEEQQARRQQAMQEQAAMTGVQSGIDAAAKQATRQ